MMCYWFWQFNFRRSILSHIYKYCAFPIQSTDGNIIPEMAENRFKITEENAPGENNLIQFYFVKF